MTDDRDYRCTGCEKITVGRENLTLTPEDVNEPYRCPVCGEPVRRMPRPVRRGVKGEGDS